MLLDFVLPQLKRGPFYTDNEAQWWALKDTARLRSLKGPACGYCEYCWLRSIQDLHHRTYDRKGRELLNDMMVLCRPCHRYIHDIPLTNRITFKAGSLLAKKDSGFDRTKQWSAYLRGIK